MQSLARSQSVDPRSTTLRRVLCLLLAMAVGLSPLIQAVASLHGIAHGERSHLLQAHVEATDAHADTHAHSGQPAGAEHASLLHAFAHAAQAGSQAAVSAIDWQPSMPQAPATLSQAHDPAASGRDQREGPFRPPASA